MIYKNFWRRFGALLIDVILVLAVLCLLGALAMGVWKMFGGAITVETLLNQPIILSAAASVLAYDVFMTKKYGGTVGKLLMGVYITDLGGNPLGWGRATARLFSKVGHYWVFSFLGFLVINLLAKAAGMDLTQEEVIVPIFGVLLFVLRTLMEFSGYYFAFFTKKRQALHDLMAGTLVVRKPKVKKDRDEGVAVTHP